MASGNLSRRDFIRGTGATLAGLAIGSALPGIATVMAEEKQAETKVRVAYFSPTQGTLNAAAALAERISPAPQYEDLTLPANREKELAFAADELAIFAAPSYGGRTPNVNLFANVKGEGTPAVVLAAYGNRHYDDQLAEMRHIVEQRGFKVIGAIGVITPHVFSEKLGRNRPNQADRATIAAFAAKIQEKLAASQLDAIEIPGNPEPPVKELKTATKEFKAENCVNCKMCVNMCPVRAIDNDTLAIDEAVCVACQRCTYVCEFGARTYDPAGPRAYLESNYFKARPIEYFL